MKNFHKLNETPQEKETLVRKNKWDRTEKKRTVKESGSLKVEQSQIQKLCAPVISCHHKVATC